MAETTLSVVAGLATGIVFIVLMSLIEFETPIGNYTAGLIDDINPRFDIDDINRKKAVDIMLQNATVTDLLEGRNVYISAIAVMQKGCSFGPCARIELWQQDATGNFIPKQAQAFIDYPDQKVIRFEYTNGW